MEYLTIDVTIRGIQSDQATAAIASNAIPGVVASSPALKTMIDLPTIHTTMYDVALPEVKKPTAAIVQ